MFQLQKFGSCVSLSSDFPTRHLDQEDVYTACREVEQK